MKRTRNQKLSEQDPVPRKIAKKGETTPGTWVVLNGFMYADFNSQPSDLILGFDMDSTLIKTKSGRTFAVNDDDWQLLYENIPTQIQKNFQEGYRIVIFTNQKGVEAGKQSLEGLQTKISNIVATIGVPILAIAALADNQYRKPCTGMWDYLISHLNGGVPVSVQQSKYVGDAAGRPAKGKRKKDFNDNDLKFALNLGVKFYTPEQFFLKEKEKLPKLVFDPKNIARGGPLTVGGELESEEQQAVVFIGSPGSGKSTFWSNHMKSYVRVNRDTLHTQERCQRAMETALGEGKSCVIDNTNPTVVARSQYVKIAKRHGVKLRAFIFSVSKDLAFHMDTLRKVNPYREHLSKRVGRMPIHKFFKDFQKPTLQEGFDEVVQVNLVGGPFDSEEDERYFYNYAYS